MDRGNVMVENFFIVRVSKKLTIELISEGVQSKNLNQMKENSDLVLQSQRSMGVI